MLLCNSVCLGSMLLLVYLSVVGPETPLLRTFSLTLFPSHILRPLHLLLLLDAARFLMSQFISNIHTQAQQKNPSTQINRVKDG